MAKNAKNKQAPLSLKRNMIWNSAGAFTNMLCQWLVTVVVVRIAAGYGAAGVYSLAMAVYSIFSPLANYRMYTYQVSDVKNENTPGEYLTFKIITCMSAFVLCFGYALITCPLSAVPVVTIFAAYKLITLIIDVCHACMQKHSRMDYIGISLALQGVLSLAAFSTVFWFTGNLFVAILSMAVTVALVGLLYAAPHALMFDSFRAGITWAKVRHLLIACLPFVLAGIASATSASVPRQFIQSMFGDSMLGVYAAVAAPVAVIPFASQYVYYPLIGKFADLFHAQNSKSFGRLLIQVSLGMAGIGLACAIALHFLGGLLLELVFANSISDYLYLLQPLIFSAVLQAYQWFMNDLLIALRDHRGGLFGGVISLVVSLVTCVPFLKVLELNGATFAVALAATVAALFMLARVLLALKRSKRQSD